MLKDGVVLLVLGVIAIGGIVVWWTQGATHSLSATAEPQVQVPEPAPKIVPAVAKTARLPRPDLVPPLELAAVVEAAVIPEVPPAPPVVQQDPPPFPAVEQITAGVREDSITGKFGDPALSAVTSTGGHLVETFVYARDRGRMATVIRLEDGKVAGAYSRSEPPRPAGLSAPRRWHSE